MKRGNNSQSAFKFFETTGKTDGDKLEFVNKADSNEKKWVSKEIFRARRDGNNDHLGQNNNQVNSPFSNL